MSQTDLITIPAPQDALQVFTTEGGIDPLIARIRREVDGFTADISTAKGRVEAVAAERARAEREAAEERDRVERAATAERRRAEEEAARVEAAAKAERDAAARREQQLHLDAEAAERRAAETELRVKREAEDRARREAEEAARREADTRRRNRIQREAVAALVAGGITEDVPKLTVTMIARKAVPHVAIAY